MRCPAPTVILTLLVVCLLVEQHGLLNILRDDDGRYSTMSRDVASSRRHVTQFTLRPLR